MYSKSLMQIHPKKSVCRAMVVNHTRMSRLSLTTICVKVTVFYESFLLFHLHSDSVIFYQVQLDEKSKKGNYIDLHEKTFSFDCCFDSLSTKLTVCCVPIVLREWSWRDGLSCLRTITREDIVFFSATHITNIFFCTMNSALLPAFTRKITSKHN